MEGSGGHLLLDSEPLYFEKIPRKLPTGELSAGKIEEMSAQNG